FHSKQNYSSYALLFNWQLGLAKWDGNVWSELGGTNSLNSPTVAVNGIVPLACVTSDKYGNIYTAGRLLNAENKYYVAKWDGTTWTELVGTKGIGNSLGFISSLALDKYNNLYAVSILDTPNNNIIYKWNGNDWIALPNFNSDETNGSICIDTAGNLYTSVHKLASNNLVINSYVAQYDKAYTVSIEEHTTENFEVKIYPNPTNEIINVELGMINEETEIKIIDVLGKEMMNEKLKIENAIIQINVSELPNGIYFVQIKTDKGIGARKIVVQR
ncbi:MAG: T9SS type A sorting domain-containing protein, partial [Bacteroidetes bacterium]|nr:T9SS type A sorting domain-containing protein [Bacteroidota bacterium]